MIAALKNLFSPAPFKHEAHAAYLRIVEQSRQPWFYKECGVADTLDGRFDVIVLHMFLVIRCLHKKNEAVEFIRALSELFFADMDRSLREMGVGDMGVGKRVKKMAEAFYGRLDAYGKSIENPNALREALRRNLFRETQTEEKNIAALHNYVLRNMQHLKNGEVNFLN